MGMGGMREEIIVNNGNTTIIENGRSKYFFIEDEEVETMLP